MVRGTTPTFVLTIRDETIDLGEAQSVYVTITQPGLEITKTGEDVSVDQNVVQCWLSQEESLQLTANSLTEIQVNWTYLGSDNETVLRAATEIKAVKIGRQLLPEVLT